MLADMDVDVRPFWCRFGWHVWVWAGDEKVCRRCGKDLEDEEDV